MNSSTVCRVCGRTFSKRGGIRHLSAESIRDFKRLGIEAEDMCMSCAMDKVKELSLEREERLGDLKAELRECEKNVLTEIQVMTTPHPESWMPGVKGVVSGYAVVGVGALTGLANMFTDIFGGESEEYLQKIRNAERHAVNVAKMQALSLGANIISGMRLEVKSGNTGTILVSCVGTAVEHGSVNVPGFERVRETAKEYAELRRRRMPIVAGSSESYAELSPSAGSYEVPAHL
ncbi:MAG: YbjQ family protein [Mailhella sp.]|nr:YbjQ family protein [Mailhella sp.]